MANGLLVEGVSGEVSSVSVQSSINRNWALLGRKWHGLGWKRHEIQLQQNELVVLKCQGGDCVLELKSLGNPHGDTIVQQDVSRVRLRTGERRRFALRQGQALALTTASIRHPWERLGAITETETTVEDFLLVLTVGGGAELEEQSTGDIVWSSRDDDEFLERFPDFIDQEDVYDILNYLEDIGELTRLEADRCEVFEESISGRELAGMIRDR